MYHDVIKDNEFEYSGFNKIGAIKYKLEYSNFKEQIRIISDLINNQEELKKANENKTFFITFDDGGISSYTYILPILEEFNLKGYFFITTSYINKQGFLNEKQIIEMRNRGHVIGSHSHTHPKMSYMSYAEMKKEWKTSINILEQILGERIKVASIPGGFSSDEVAQAAKECGIEILFNSEPTKKIVLIDNMRLIGRYDINSKIDNKRVIKILKNNKAEYYKNVLGWRIKETFKKSTGKHYFKVRKFILKY